MAMLETEAAAITQQSSNVVSATADDDATLAQRTAEASCSGKPAAEKTTAQAMRRLPYPIHIPGPGAMPREEAAREVGQPHSVPACQRPCLLPAAISRTGSATPQSHLPGTLPSVQHAQHPVSTTPASARADAAYQPCPPRFTGFAPAQQVSSVHGDADMPKSAAGTRSASPDTVAGAAQAATNMTLRHMHTQPETQGNSIRSIATSQDAQHLQGEHYWSLLSNLDDQAADTTDEPGQAEVDPCMQGALCTAGAGGGRPPGVCAPGAQQTSGVMQAQRPVAEQMTGGQSSTRHRAAAVQKENLPGLTVHQLHQVCTLS